MIFRSKIFLKNILFNALLSIMLTLKKLLKSKDIYFKTLRKIPAPLTFKKKIYLSKV